MKERIKKAFTIIELVLVIIVIGILFVAFLSKTDNTTEKAKLAGVQADFRSFYTATKSVGLESQLWLLSDEEFEKKLNDNLDLPLQFKDGVSAEKDPWNENYVYMFKKDVVNQTAYVMFASKGDRDEYHLSIEDVVKAYGSDFYKITMGFKQYQTLFSAIDTDAFGDAEVYEEMHDEINFKFAGVDTATGLKYGAKYKYEYAGETVIRIFYKNGFTETFIDGEQVSTDGTKFKYRDNKNGTTTIYNGGVLGTQFGVCSADGTEIELAYGVTAYLVTDEEADLGEPGYDSVFKWKPSDGYEAVAGATNIVKLDDFFLTKAQIDSGVRIRYTAPNGGILTQDGLGFLYDGYASNFMNVNAWKVPNDNAWCTETGFYAMTNLTTSIGGESYNPHQLTVEVFVKKSEEPVGPSYEGSGVAIPAGGTYYVGVTANKTGEYTGATLICTEGMEFPKELHEGDVYVYEDYEYRYKQQRDGTYWDTLTYGDGWGVEAINKTKQYYEDILTKINGKDILSLSYCFDDCRELLESPAIPNTVKSLQYTYSRCHKLEKAPKIPNGVVNMMCTFSTCYDMYTYEEAPIGTSYGDFSGYTIPNGVEEFHYAFGNCDSMEISPFIPNSATNIRSLYSGCNNLWKVSNIPTGVTALNSVFADCISLTDVPNIPYGVKSIEYTFKGCTSLVEMPDIPNSTTSLSQAFYLCTVLSVVKDIPDSVQNMSSTFSGCTSLKTGPKLPNNITSLNQTFRDCTSLETAPVIPENVLSLNKTFYGCTSLGGTVEIQGRPDSYTETFKGTQITGITGACPEATKEALMATK